MLIVGSVAEVVTMILCVSANALKIRAVAFHQSLSFAIFATEMEAGVPVSEHVVIMTKAELKALERAAFQKGVRRGAFEQLSDKTYFARLNTTPNTLNLGE